MLSINFSLFLLLVAPYLVISKKDRFKTLTDAELDALDDDWEEGDDLEPLDIPEHKRPKPEFSNEMFEDMLRGNKAQQDGDVRMQEHLLKKSKKHKTLMMFVSVIDLDFIAKTYPRKTGKNKYKQGSTMAARKFTEEITEQWEGMLFNNHLFVDRFIPEDDQVVLKMEDGSKAFEVRDFLTQQENCFKVVIENHEYKGAGYLKKYDQDQFEAKSKDEL